jgi:hypothetical protein
MPKSYRDSTGINTRYENVSEFPVNVKRFVRELSSLGLDNIIEIIYNEFIPHEGIDEEAFNDLDIGIEIDAEDAAKNKPANFKEKLTNDAKNLAQYFGIDSVYIYVSYTNKEEFAKKFLKQLKAYLKTTVFGPKIHSIGFNDKGSSVPEIRITKKRDSWSVSNTRLKEVALEYLQTLGYPNVKIYFVN